MAKQSFSQKQLHLHNECIIILQQIEANKLERISIGVDSMKYQHDYFMLPNVKTLHIELNQHKLAELDTKRMELLSQYAELVQQLIQPVIDRIS
jgi:hypothetical protein